MTENEMRPVMARNIARLRKQLGMTQAELAEKLSYSDKTVSKWERGEGLPDLVSAAHLAEIFGLPLDALLRDENAEAAVFDEEAAKAQRNARRKLILLLSVGLCVLVSVLAYFALRLLLPSFHRAWLCFLYGVPAAMIVCIVFTCIWWKNLLRLAAISGLIWSIAACVHITFPVSPVWLIYVVAAVVQLLFIAWFRLLHVRRIDRAERDKK